MTQAAPNSPRHAYLITAHDKPDQLITLLGLLDEASNDLYLHIDKKAADIHDGDLIAAVRHASIQFVPRLDARWGSEVFIDAIVSLLKEAVKTEHVYYHLLSGVDLPLKPQKEIHKFFEEHPGKEFVAFDQKTADPNVLVQRLGRYSLSRPVNPLALRVYKRIEPVWNGLQAAVGVNRLKRCPVVFQKGAVWFSITHPFARFVLEQMPRYRPYYRKSVCADEIWLQTILVNSLFMERRFFSGWDDELAATMRYVDWSDGGRSPKVLTNADFDALMASGALFARKFDRAVDTDVFDKIAQAVRCVETD
ncbi:MAG: beta-1,6-N-acetylglucosaminyltransferase [Clostridiaceae bacterium]